MKTNVSRQLAEWAERDDRGQAFSNVGFLLPDGSMRGPAAAWVSNAKLVALTAEELRGFPPVCPEFVVEVMSWNFSLEEMRQRMKSWIANGAKLAWLVDAERRLVEVNRVGDPYFVVEGEGGVVAGKGVVAGFVLRLEDVWR